MSNHHYIACDLGAESGRVILGTLDEGTITLEEIHRFANGGVQTGDSLRWDVQRLFRELKVGLAGIAARGIVAESVSCDSWGVDYVLLHKDGSSLGAPYHYRDKRTNGALEKAFQIVPAEKIFEETGIQFLTINTLYQLLEDLRTRPLILQETGKFLNIGDYFNFLLSGVCKAEASLASTTQLFNPRTHAWSDPLIRHFGLPRSIFPDIVPSGTILGDLDSAVARETRLPRCPVVAGCSHDTAAAVAAIPGSGDHWAFLSSGTWSLLGTELPQPVITGTCREYQFTNEVGFGGSIRLLNNIAGLWIVQECRRCWAQQGESYSYEQLTKLAEDAAPSAVLIDLGDPRFLNPDNMLFAIQEYCRETHQPELSTPGETIRSVLESLAAAYAKKLLQLEEVTGRESKTLHVVGGGSRNAFLNQLTSDAIGRPVIAGPAECTAIGNILVQAMALGHIPSLGEAREIVRNSFPVTRLEPGTALKSVEHRS